MPITTSMLRAVKTGLSYKVRQALVFTKSNESVPWLKSRPHGSDAAMNLAIEQCTPDIVKVLLEHVDFTVPELTNFLIKTLTHRQYRSAEFLVAAGADVGELDEEEWASSEFTRKQILKLTRMVLARKVLA